MATEKDKTILPLEKCENAVHDELRQIYCCKGAEFCRPTLQKAWLEIARLQRERDAARADAIEECAKIMRPERCECGHVWHGSERCPWTGYEEESGELICECPESYGVFTEDNLADIRRSLSRKQEESRKKAKKTK